MACWSRVRDKSTDGLGGKTTPKFQTKSTGCFHCVKRFIPFMMDFFSLYNTPFYLEERLKAVIPFESPRPPMSLYMLLQRLYHVFPSQERIVVRV